MDASKTKSELYNEWIEIPGNREKKNAATKAWREKNAAKVAAYRADYRRNPVVKVYELYMKKQWQLKNPDKVKQHWRTKNEKEKGTEKVKARNKSYREQENSKDRRNERSRDRFKNDVQFRLGVDVRNRTVNFLKNKCRSKRTHELIGCTQESFKVHIESKFKDGMNWNNYGEWQIDHIIPLTKFDLTVDDQLQKVCHFSNLQPLWAMDNMSKGNK